MTDHWTPMLVIRPESGKARLEDSQLQITEEVSRAVLARQIASEAAKIGSFDIAQSPILDATLFDWVSKGWRPSLEYFDWSEGQDGAISEPFPAQAVTTDSNTVPESGALARWRWAEVAAAARASDRSVGDVLIHRRTIRSYDARPLDQTIFARILHDFVQALNATDDPGFRVGLRLTTVVYAVAGLRDGVWNLDLSAESATLTYSGGLRDEMSELMCGMQAAKTAAVTVILIADFQDRQRRFPYERALRELYVEVGRIAQWLILICESYDVSCLITPATNDKTLSKILRLPPREAPVYTITFGLRDSDIESTAS